jgi:hypothetical protein
MATKGPARTRAFRLLAGSFDVLHLLAKLFDRCFQRKPRSRQLDIG